MPKLAHIETTGPDVGQILIRYVLFPSLNIPLDQSVTSIQPFRDAVEKLSVWKPRKTIKLSLTVSIILAGALILDFGQK